MYKELKARLQAKKRNATEEEDDALEAIEQLERQLADRDAEIAKYRDAPVVAWVNKRVQNYIEWNSAFNLPSSTQLIVKPGEQ